MTARLSQLRRTAINAMCRQMACERDGVYMPLHDASGAEEAARYPSTTQGPQAPGTGQEEAKTDANGDV